MKCVPDGWCSQSYLIRRGELEGKVSFSNEAPFGFINDGHQDYSVEVGGRIKRRWELRNRDAVVITANKKIGFKRVVKLEADGKVYTLSRKSGSDAMVLDGPGTSVYYKRIHFLTRRQRITGQWSDDRLVIFGFWFVVYYDQLDSAFGEIAANVVYGMT